MSKVIKTKKSTKTKKTKRSRSRSTKKRPKKDEPKLVKTLTNNLLAQEKCSAVKLKVGNCLERLSYYYVVNVSSNYIEVMNEDGE